MRPPGVSPGMVGGDGEHGTSNNLYALVQEYLSVVEKDGSEVFEGNAMQGFDPAAHEERLAADLLDTFDPTGCEAPGMGVANDVGPLFVVPRGLAQQPPFVTPYTESGDAAGNPLFVAPCGYLQPPPDVLPSHTGPAVPLQSYAGTSASMLPPAVIAMGLVSPRPHWGIATRPANGVSDGDLLAHAVVQQDLFRAQNSARALNRAEALPQAAAAAPTKRGRRVSREDKWAPHKELLLMALEGLYYDKLEPLVPTVARRMEEVSTTMLPGENGEMALPSRWPSAQLKELARSTRGVVVEEKPGDCNRCRFFLKGRKRDFVDQSSLNDPYPAEVWQEVKAAVEEGRYEGLNSQSRYDLALTLRETIPILKGYKLGEVCHILHLAVNVHRLLGYREGRLVPYKASFNYEKTQNAVTMKPTAARRLETCPHVESWQEVCDIISELLAQTPEKGIPLSALKERIRKQFGRELSETAMGHTKLSSFVEDPRLAMNCRLQQVGTEKFLVPAPTALHFASSRRQRRKLTWLTSGREGIHQDLLEPNRRGSSGSDEHSRYTDDSTENNRTECFLEPALAWCV